MRIAFRAALIVLVIALSAGPALATSSVLSKADPKGDVAVAKTKKLSTSKKKSIDIDRATVLLLDNGRYRFKIRMKKLYTSKKWDQMVFVSSSFPGDDPRTVSIGFRVRNSTAAYAYDDETEENCGLKVKRDGRTVSVDVPARCAPHDGQTVRLDTYTGHWQTDEKPYSRDHMNVGKWPSE